jgi:hypothetical protein
VSAPDPPRTVLISTLHDPSGRLLPALHARAAGMGQYGGVFVRATEATDARLVRLLRSYGVEVGSGDAQIGAARRAALGEALAAGHASVLYCDFDRWLHWAGRFPDELAAVPARLLRRRPRPWYACLGRTARAFASHPYVQRMAERATNHALSLAVGRRVDATAGACWLSGEGAALIVRESTEPTNATDLEWPALVHRAAPRRLAYLATEGLEFETAEFFAAEVAAAGGAAAWARARYERPEVWRARLELAAASIRAACAVRT